MSADFIAVIPARYASARLPGKALAELAGRPMIEWVYRRAVASGAREVIVATDDERIAAAARGFGARAELTAERHPSGTDRIAELAQRLGWHDRQIVVNVQRGVVQLRGEVPSADMLEALVERTRDVQGVQRVESLLHLPGTPAPMHQ